MGRIRFISIGIELSPKGYSVRVSVVGTESVIRRDEYERLSWREARELVELLADEFRPGLELLDGGVQEPLF